jgi:hypothetical protein
VGLLLVKSGPPNKGINPTRLLPLQSAEKRAFRLVSVKVFFAAAAARGYAQLGGDIQLR